MEYRIRRATLDDLPTLKNLWATSGFEVAELEKRLTEFQVAETTDGNFLGALGFQIARGQGCLNHEAFADFSVADSMRPEFWKRLQVVASNHGVLRVWVRENSPRWSPLGFQPPTEEALNRLPEAWDRSAPGWLTLQLKDENAMAKLEKEMAIFMTAEKQRSQKIIEGARAFRFIATVLGFLLAFLIMGAAIWLYLARHSAGTLTP